MHTEHHKWRSPNLGHDMELKVYGNYGKPMLAFPSSEGRYHDYEGFGMIEACRPFIEDQKLKVIAVDSIDSDSWMARHNHPAERGRRHAAYEAYIIAEVVPLIYRICNQDRLAIITTGCSLGAYHAANFFFKHPDLFDTAILLSGVYGLEFNVGDYVDENVYFNDPLKYLPNLEDPEILEKYRRSQIIIGCGQGAWEEECLADSYRLSEILTSKHVDHWLDIWGHDVAHEWPWWQKMMAYFLARIGL